MFGVEESVPQQELFTLQVLIFLVNIVPSHCHGPQVPLRKALLVLAKLSDEGHADLKIGTSRVQKLECLDHRPVVLLHDVGS